MTEVLLKELNSSDINWLQATGQPQELAAGTQLIQAGQPLDCFYILIEGNLASTIPQVDNNPLVRAFAALDDTQTTGVGVEIARLSSGEIIGETSLINLRPPATTVTAITKARVLSVPLLQLETKLEADIGFAARLYRAIAILLADKLATIIARLGQNKLAPDTAIKDVLYVFGELNDSDLDWLIANGDRLTIPPKTTLIEQGSTVDALQILLNGQISLTVSEDERNPLSRIFAAIEDRSMGTEIARLSKGDTIGETAFIDGRLPATTATTTKETTTLSISRSLLSDKLQQDVGFAARFYRTISALSADRLQGMLNRLAHSRRMYHKGQSLNESVEYADELNGVALDRIALAGKRFDWMLEQSKAS